MELSVNKPNGRVGVFCQHYYSLSIWKKPIHVWNSYCHHKLVTCPHSNTLRGIINMSCSLIYVCSYFLERRLSISYYYDLCNQYLSAYFWALPLMVIKVSSWLNTQCCVHSQVDMAIRKLPPDSRHLVKPSSHEPQFSLWGPEPWGWPSRRLVPPFHHVSGNSRLWWEPGWPRGTWGERQTQVQVGVSMEQCQIWYVCLKPFWPNSDQSLIVCHFIVCFPLLVQAGRSSQRPASARPLLWPCLDSLICSVMEVRDVLLVG